MSRIICFIPARSGSTRLPGKNIRELAGHPLMAYTIAVALDSGIFDKVYVVSDSREYLQIAWEYGALGMGEDSNKDWTKSRDFDWMKAALDSGYLRPDDDWMLLRPTSPFKTARTLGRAFGTFEVAIVDQVRKQSFAKAIRKTKILNLSVRAVKPTSCHPLKSWVFFRDEIHPFIPQDYHGSPRFENQTQNLGKVWIQSATLEIGHASVLKTGTLSGERIFPYFCQGHEGVDINTEEDWLYCEFLIEKGLAKLPEVRKI